jgi:hypothetical protein
MERLQYFHRTNLDNSQAATGRFRLPGTLSYLARRASMATSAYMSVTGEKQGLITADAFTADSVANIQGEELLPV